MVKRNVFTKLENYLENFENTRELILNSVAHGF